MEDKIRIFAAVSHKHLTAAEWENSDYVPAAGEIIVYDEDADYGYKRFKIGDGSTLGKKLHFAIFDWALQENKPEYEYTEINNLLKNGKIDAELIPETNKYDAQLEQIEKILKNKIDKKTDVAGNWTALVTEPGSTSPTWLNVTYSPTNGAIAKFSSQGRLKSNIPEEDLDCTNKKYVDELVTDLSSDVRTVEAIAKGRATGYVFQSKAEMDQWLNTGACLYYGTQTSYSDTFFNELEVDGQIKKIPTVAIVIDSSDIGEINSYSGWVPGEGSIFYEKTSQKYYEYWDGFLYEKISYQDLDVSSLPKIVFQVQLGDNLYIIDTGVPDYWWDGNEAQPLETQKVNLSEYVKNTDYPTTDKAGVVKVDSNYGLLMVKDANKNLTGELRLQTASVDDIRKRRSNNAITPYRLAEAVKSALIDPRDITNPNNQTGNVWDYQDQLKAQRTLGVHTFASSFVFENEDDMNAWLDEPYQFIYYDDVIAVNKLYAPFIKTEDTTLTLAWVVSGLTDPTMLPPEFVWIINADDSIDRVVYNLSNGEYYILVSTGEEDNYMWQPVSPDTDSVINLLPVELKIGNTFYILDENSPNYFFGGHGEDVDEERYKIYPFGLTGLKSLDIRNGKEGIYNFYPDDSTDAELLTTLDLRDIYNKMGQIEQAIIDVNEAISNYSGGE